MNALPREDLLQSEIEEEIITVLLNNGVVTHASKLTGHQMDYVRRRARMMILLIQAHFQAMPSWSSK